jgi:flavorubredoxin
MPLDSAIELRPGLHWIGVTDPGLRIFDDLFPTAHGTTYNSYLVRGSDKIAVIDTVKGERRQEFLDKLSSLVDPADIDYYVVNHTEPDHSGSLAAMLKLSPKATVVSTQAAKTFLANQIHEPIPCQVIKDGESIDLGGKTLRFVIAPFLHWPDTMFTYLEEEGALFTCDAFGAHYCGNSLYADDLPDYPLEVESYFDAIIRPFKDKVLAAIAKIRSERLELLCPSHGPVIRHDPWQTVRRYEGWCQPPTGGPTVLILYLSPHHNTERMAATVARGAESVAGVRVLLRHITDLTMPEIRDLMEKADAIIFGIPTINRDIPKPMWEVLSLLSTVKLKGNLAGVFGSFGWSGEACRLAEERLKGIGYKLPLPAVRAQFTPRPEVLEQCTELGRTVASEILKK